MMDPLSYHPCMISDRNAKDTNKYLKQALKSKRTLKDTCNRLLAYYIVSNALIHVSLSTLIYIQCLKAVYYYIVYVQIQMHTLETIYQVYTCSRSVTVRVRHHANTRRKERVELPLGFREKPRNSMRGRENLRDKITRLIRVLCAISCLGLQINQVTLIMIHNKQMITTN